MPQMAPLMWNMIFLITSILLMMTLSKMYFILGVKKKEEFNQEKKMINNFNKSWLW